MRLTGALVLRGGLFALVACVGSGACGAGGSREWEKISSSRPAQVEGGGELHGMERGPEETLRERAQARLVDDRAAFPEEIEAIKKLMQRAAEIRQLEFVRDVAVRVQSKEGIRKYLRGFLGSEPMRRAYARYMALGVFTPDTTEQGLSEEASKLELLGYYEPHEDYLVLRSDVAYGLAGGVGGMQDNVEWRSTIIHELVHALQDQHFDLGAGIDRKRTTDEHHAYMALVEGDATLCELQYVLGRIGIKFAPLVEDLYQFDRALNGLPGTSMQSAMGTPLKHQPGMFRYRAGAVFAAGLWREGGTAGLNRAFRKPPQTVEEVMDPLLYLGGHKTSKYRLPRLSSLTKAGYRLHHEDTLGRIELAAYLQQTGMGGDLRAATWLGDRIAILERDGVYVAVWLIKMSSIDDVRAITERAIDFGRDVDGKPDPRILAFRHIDFALIARNIDPKLQPALRRELSDWIDRDGVLGK